MVNHLDSEWKLLDKQKPPQLRRGLMFLVRRVRDLNSRKIVIPWRISNTQSHKEDYGMCAINVLCFLDYFIRANNFKING